ncbi:unnamed protein product [Schistocephalus solidus]|uniref:Secreted protein n=1 Tax=Schistocephalus solidus TaxID=70667 RepID=A0A183TC77_SCHSO|nr:unnamed protein product [Schistocephalus solidus]
MFTIILALNLMVAADLLVCTAPPIFVGSAKTPTQGGAAFQMQSVDEAYECTHARRCWWKATTDVEQEGIKREDTVLISSTKWDGVMQPAWTLHTTR